MIRGDTGWMEINWGKTQQRSFAVVAISVLSGFLSVVRLPISILPQVRRVRLVWTQPPEKAPTKKKFAVLQHAAARFKL